MTNQPVSIVRLMNLILQQVSTKPGVLFPKEKGWRAWLPELANNPVFNPTGFFVENETSQIFFAPCNENVPFSLWSHYLPNNLSKLIRGTDKKKLEVFFVLNDANLKRVIKQTEIYNGNISVLIPKENKLSFLQGGFKDLRLQYRLEQLEFDPELISDQLYPYPPDLVEKEEKSLFLQRFFHEMNKGVFLHEKVFDPIDLLKHAFPAWDLLQKTERKMTIIYTKKTFEWVITVFLSDFLAWREIKSKSVDLPKHKIHVLFDVADRKSFKGWIQAQKQSLSWLKKNANQLQLNFFED